ncbi:hypothetical protein GCM10010266_59600 [Streptomyces griseomycini]|nr:hypothetical protein GCM10010266_59600 [Streptomyces griseomycini]
MWPSFRFPPGFREAEELMPQRGAAVPRETVRRWCGKPGQAHANGPHRRRPRLGDGRRPDEVSTKVSGERKDLWRAVAQDGDVLGILVQSRRDEDAVRRFLRRPLTRTRSPPRTVVTDRLRSCSAVRREAMPSASTARTRLRTTGPRTATGPRGSVNA